MYVDPSALLAFCRAVEETANAGLELFDREDLLAAIEQLKALQAEVERTKLKLFNLANRSH